MQAFEYATILVSSLVLTMTDWQYQDTIDVHAAGSRYSNVAFPAKPCVTH
jgi:hypothetical protein